MMMTANPEHKEFWASYDGKESHPSSCHTNPPTQIMACSEEKLFAYVDHNTTCLQAVALRFMSLDGKTVVVKFFNVVLKGVKKNYPAEHQGQFNSKKLSGFRKFWMLSVGKEPYRWSTVHKSIRSNLKGLIFKCSYEVAKDKKGQLYNRVTEIELYDPETK